MRTLFDLMNRWLGTSFLIRLSSNVNKRPIAVDDSLSLPQDSAAVLLDVLANDADPEGQPLVLVSASAIAGLVEVTSGNLLRYTPPAGFAGSDSIVYEIADDLDQRSTAQVNVTITPPVLALTQQADNTLAVEAAMGPLGITLSDPARFAGSYGFAAEDVLTGPVPLELPAISGLSAEGEMLSATPGLWAYDPAAGLPVRSWQWVRGGVEIAAATGQDYTIAPGDLEAGLVVREGLADAFGQRFATRIVPGSAFHPSLDEALLAWWDAADTASITETDGQVSAWADKALGLPLQQGDAAAQPRSGTRSLNGLNVIDFDGTQFLGANRDLPVSGDVAFHMVVVLDTQSSIFDSILSVDATQDFQIESGNTEQFNGRLNVSGIGTSIDLTGGPYSGALILSVVFDMTQAGLADVFIADQLRGQMALDAPLDTSVLLRVMANRAANLMNDGAVAELILSGDVSNRAEYHSYLANKWGLV